MQSQLMHLQHTGSAPKTWQALGKREQKTGRTSRKDVCSKALELRNVRVAALTRLQKQGCLNKTTPINKPNQGQDPYTY